MLVKELNKGDLEVVKSAVNQQLEELYGDQEEETEENTRRRMNEVLAD